jgi:protein TonB
LISVTDNFIRPRIAAITGGVLLFHIAALWALQSGLLMRAVELVVPVAMLTEIVEMPVPKVEPVPPKPEPVAQPVVTRKPSVAVAAPRPVAIADSTPSPEAVTGVLAPQPALPPIATPVAQAPSPPPAARIELPSTNADYLQNPRPAYPPQSRRLGEQGRVIHSVLISADGTPVSAKLVKSSGFARLDEAAYAAVMKWRYVPGKRNGVAEAMNFNVPIEWVLD